MTNKFLVLVFLIVISSDLQGQNKTKDLSNKPSITTSEITVPQLITQNLNRSSLSFNFGATDSKFFSLGINFRKFRSTNRKQISLYGFLSTSKTVNKLGELVNFEGNTSQLSLGWNAKYFNSKNRFIEIGLQGSGSHFSGFTESARSGSSSTNLAIGIGRIEYINDGYVAQNIIDRLRKIGLLKNDLSDMEIKDLTHLIGSIKNTRVINNRSYSKHEIELISDFLYDLGAIDKSSSALIFIDETYKYEPIIDRTTGSQWRLNGYSNYRTNTFALDLSRFSLGAEITWSKNRYLNKKWQWNTSMSLFTEKAHFRQDDADNFGVYMAGIRVTNDVDYLIDNRSVLSLRNTIGYLPINEAADNFYPFVPVNSSRFYMNTSLSYEFQTSRQTSVTLGLHTYISNKGSSSGLSVGIRF